MSHQIIRPDDTNIRLMKIRAGMPVYDLLVEKLGVVKYVQFSDESPGNELVVNDAAVQTAPAPIQHRLLETGYIRVNTGLLRKDFFVYADQIEDVDPDGVYLHRLREELLTL